MAHQERTCIACRKTGPRNSFIRIVVHEGRIIIDYRGKLPGRGAHVCQTPSCISKAFQKEVLSRAFHGVTITTDAALLKEQLAQQLIDRILALISMAVKSGYLAAGFSAVADALHKGTAFLVLFATDISDGTESKIRAAMPASMRHISLFTREELGRKLNRELVGIIAILDEGIAQSLWNESELLKNLI